VLYTTVHWLNRQHVPVSPSCVSQLYLPAVTVVILVLTLQVANVDWLFWYLPQRGLILARGLLAYSSATAAYHHSPFWQLICLVWALGQLYQFIHGWRNLVSICCHCEHLPFKFTSFCCMDSAAYWITRLSDNPCVILEQVRIHGQSIFFNFFYFYAMSTISYKGHPVSFATILIKTDYFLNIFIWTFCFYCHCQSLIVYPKCSGQVIWKSIVKLSIVLKMGLLGIN
jgi:hypothetical protein